MMTRQKCHVQGCDVTTDLDLIDVNLESQHVRMTEVIDARLNQAPFYPGVGEWNGKTRVAKVPFKVAFEHPLTIVVPLCLAHAVEMIGAHDSPETYMVTARREAI
jgi:hypothetical protein